VIGRPQKSPHPITARQFAKRQITSGTLPRMARAIEDGCIMLDRSYLSELTVAELYKCAVGYAARGKAATTGDIRDMFNRLARRYAVMAAERGTEEKKATV
jgi:hypothetical protein